jgi:hypothetical protein
MKKLIFTLTILVLVGPLLTISWAQHQSGKGMNKQMYTHGYNTETVDTIKGEVVEITYNPSKGTATTMGVHMVVQTDTATIAVHLGPIWYMVEQEPIRKGEIVTVTGSRITYNDAPAIIAATVKRNERTLQLRDANGYPVWRGWRSNRPVNQ